MKPRVCVVGSVNMDLIVTCPRLPVPGETVTEGKFAEVPGGKGANQALATYRAGADVTFVGAVGDDAIGDAALTILREAGIDLDGITTVRGIPTGVASIVVDAKGENQIAVAPGANVELTGADVSTAGFDAVLCQLEITDEAVLAAAQQATGLFCVNAAPARPLPDYVIERADVIIVNETENAALSDQLAGYAGLLVITYGARGAEAFRDGVSVGSAEPPKVEPIDTVGAGDAFCGSLVTDLARGLEIHETLARACEAGAIATTIPGAQFL